MVPGWAGCPMFLSPRGRGGKTIKAFQYPFSTAEGTLHRLDLRSGRTFLFKRFNGFFNALLPVVGQHEHIAVR